MTLLKWTLLRLARRKYPEMFDPVAALEAISGRIDDYLAEGEFVAG